MVFYIVIDEWGCENIFRSKALAQKFLVAGNADTGLGIITIDTERLGAWTEQDFNATYGESND